MSDLLERLRRIEAYDASVDLFVAVKDAREAIERLTRERAEIAALLRDIIERHSSKENA